MKTAGLAKCVQAGEDWLAPCAPVGAKRPERVSDSVQVRFISDFYDLCGDDLRQYDPYEPRN